MAIIINGTSNDDNINGTPNDDDLLGGIGKDTLSGFAGDDILDGGQGQITTVRSNWYPYNYDYTLDGTTDGDIMAGGPGNDIYMVTASNSSVWGANQYVAIVNYKYAPDSFNPDVVIERVDEGKDTVIAFVSYTLPSNVENLELSKSFGVGAINGIGNSLNNFITGNDDNNQLFGKGGDDTLIGGGGKDKLTGGPGNDTFVFNTQTEIGIGGTRDVIKDFVSGQDRIDLSTLDANEKIDGNQNFSSLVVGGTFSHTQFTNPGDLYFDNATHILYGNTDTDSAPEFSILLSGVNTITTNDFSL